MADTKISALTAIVGTDVDTAADVLPIVDTSAATTKKILVDELRIALGIATQAQQETGTSLVTTVTPGRQHFNPSSPKAWGLITVPTTVTASYPAAGVSVVNNSTGVYTVTHGRTFSSADYAVMITVDNGAPQVVCVNTKTATTFIVEIVDDGGVPAAPSAFQYVIFGDL